MPSTLQNDGEVNDGGLGGNLRRVMRIAEFCRYVETKVIVVFHFLVTKSHDRHTSWTKITLNENNITNEIRSNVSETMTDKLQL